MQKIFTSIVFIIFFSIHFPNWALFYFMFWHCEIRAIWYSDIIKKHCIKKWKKDVDFKNYFLWSITATQKSAQNVNVQLSELANYYLCREIEHSQPVSKTIPVHCSSISPSSFPILTANTILAFPRFFELYIRGTTHI